MHPERATHAGVLNALDVRPHVRDATPEPTPEWSGRDPQAVPTAIDRVVVPATIGDRQVMGEGAPRAQANEPVAIRVSHRAALRSR